MRAGIRRGQAGFGRAQGPLHAARVCAGASARAQILELLDLLGLARLEVDPLVLERLLGGLDLLLEAVSVRVLRREGSEGGLGRRGCDRGQGVWLRLRARGGGSRKL